MKAVHKKSVDLRRRKRFRIMKYCFVATDYQIVSILFWLCEFI